MAFAANPRAIIAFGIVGSYTVHQSARFVFSAEQADGLVRRCDRGQIEVVPAARLEQHAEQVKTDANAALPR